MDFIPFGDTFEDRNKTWRLIVNSLYLNAERLEQEHAHEKSLIKSLTQPTKNGTDEDSLIRLRNQGGIFGQAQFKLPFKQQSLDELVKELGLIFRTQQFRPKFIQFDYNPDFSRTNLDLDAKTMGEIFGSVNLEDMRYSPTEIHYGFNEKGEIGNGLLEIGYKLRD